MPSIPDSGFGNWPSPISSELAAGATLHLSEPILYEADLWWLERDPEQGGRVDIVRTSHGTTCHRLPPQMSCRSRAHEYGGGSYCVTSDGVYFVNDQDQDIYFLSHTDQLHRITSSRFLRYADLTFDASRGRLVCIQERHYDNKPPENSVIALDIVSGQHRSLVQGHDFYASPKPSPDGTRLAWLCWNHPNMPWDCTELWFAEFDSNGDLMPPACVVSNPSVSVFQPEWSPANQLHFIADNTGWWNLYCYSDGKSRSLFQCESEFGLAQWVFAQSSYGFLDEARILCSLISDGIGKLAILDTPRGRLVELASEFNSFSYIRSEAGHACFIAASEILPAQLVLFDPAIASTRTVRNSTTVDIDTANLSRPRAIEFSTRHGDTAHAIYYPAYNPGITSSPDRKPPLIVITHGGPTAHNDAALDLRKQFWTSRGYALLDVNYSGSTGYGRAYRERLLGQWGVRDAEDCCDAALHMVNAGLVDSQRLIIKGGSAGGYTVLCALTFHQVFSAGASYYGIGELESLARETHKFEAHYLDHLVGPYPDMRTTYQQRSPINYVDQLHCPVIFFQGLEDRVVPKEQAQMMFSALKRKGVATSYLAFPGEAHGFRKAETIIACLKAELEFYARVLDLPLDEECDGTLKIENLN